MSVVSEKIEKETENYCEGSEQDDFVFHFLKKKGKRAVERSIKKENKHKVIG